MKVALNELDQKKLRENNVISEHEVAYKIGDLYVAENVLSGQRRQITVGSVIVESSGKRVLKG
tara:strand:+ start:928 stop:1116 length:189 start_codon:yes stop_codon:yes gene_type:complete